MGKGGGAKGENSKKAAGNARKADAAAAKAAQQQAATDAADSAKWQQGAKSNKKADDAAAKRADADRKKAEKAALLAAEEASLPSKPKGSGGAQKAGQKKKDAKPTAANPGPSRKLDLSALDDDEGGGDGSGASLSLNASGIDNALDALSLTGGKGGATDKVEKHPERRFKAAYAAFEARRLPEIEEENPGLRRNQRIELCRKEFEKSPDNPFNQVSARYDASKEDIAKIKAEERKKVEDRLAG